MIQVHSNFYKYLDKYLKKHSIYKGLNDIRYISTH